MKHRSAASFFHLSNLLTYFSVLLAVLVLFSSTSAWNQWNPVFLNLMVIFDLLDGRFARLFKRDSEQAQFGGQIDSLADLLSFGVTPLVMIYSQRGIAHLGEMLFLHVAGAAFYLLCSATRLAAFNTIDVKDRFIGVPTTIIGLFWSFAFLFPLQRNFAVALAILVIFGGLMISPWSIQRPGVRGFIFLILLSFVPLVIHIYRGLHFGL